MDKSRNRTKGFIKRNLFFVLPTYFFLFILGLYIGNQFIVGKTNIFSSAINNSAKNMDTNNSQQNLAESGLSTLTDETKSTDIYKKDGTKIAYLTFDDGPSVNITPGILDTLSKYKVKATFFVIGEIADKNGAIVKREWNEGHSVGNHSYCHDYKKIYSSPEKFIEDINKCDSVLKSLLGSDYNYKLLRFPGGSFGEKMAPYREAAKTTGYHYVDWNDLTGDAEGRNAPVTKLLNELKKYSTENEHIVVLMHDAPEKKTTLEALPQVIEYLQKQGYSFKTLS